MEFINSNELEWLAQQVGIIKDGSEKRVQPKLAGLQSRLKKMADFSLDFTITREDINRANNLMEELDELYSDYSKLSDISTLHRFDEIKKTLTGKLMYMATLKDLFQHQVLFNEEMLKKSIRFSIVLRIKDERNISLTQADKFVETDVEYINLKKKVFFYKELAGRIKTKYDLYLKAWQMVFQSCSTAAKELKMSKYD